MAVGQNPVSLVNISNMTKLVVVGMFIHPCFCIFGYDPYPKFFIIGWYPHHLPSFTINNEH